MRFYTDGTAIPGTENDPDEQTEEVNPATPPVEDEVPAFALEIARVNNDARSARAETERLKQELEALRNPPPPPIKLEEGDAFNNPNKLLTAFAQMLESQVGPIKRDMAESQRANVYATLKNQIRSANPAFSKIEHLVDQFMVGKEPTEANLIESVERAVGKMMLTNPAAIQTNNSEAPPTKTPVQPPPHLTSRAKTPAPSNKTDAKYDLANFNENEKRLMRERGLTPKQFVTLRDIDPNSLTPAAYKAIMEDKS